MNDLSGIFNFFKANDQFARHCGIELLSAELGSARAKMPIQPWHLNGAKTVHGGAIFTLADFVFAVAVNSHGNLAMGINTHTAFLNAATAGTLYAEASEISLNSRLATYDVRVVDEDDRLVARFQGTAYRKNVPILP
jgi:acyl-CoA thioesterase